MKSHSVYPTADTSYRQKRSAHQIASFSVSTQISLFIMRDVAVMVVVVTRFFTSIPLLRYRVFCFFMCGCSMSEPRRSNLTATTERRCCGSRVCNNGVT
eukprot:scaffold51832_cov57-Attheya_sp.AAC.2